MRGGRLACGGSAAGLAAGLVLAPLLVLASQLATAVPAGAQPGAAVTGVGWWTRRPGASAQPAGGFEVAVGLDGPESVAAVRVAVGGGLARVVLVLAEREGFLHEQAVLRVCPAADGWSPANPGPFDRAPAADCSRQVALTRNAIQASWTADVSSLLPPEGTASLAVLPVRGGLALDPGFQVRFAGASLLVEAAPAGQEGASGDAAAGVVREPFDGAAAGERGGGAGGDALLDFGPVPETAAGLSGAAGPEPAAGAAASAAGVVGTEPAGGTNAQVAGGPLPQPRLVSSPGEGRPWWRLVIVLPASAAVGLAVAAARRRLADWWASRA